MGTPSLISTYDDAVAFLDARIGHGVKPGLNRIRGLLEIMGDPHRSYPIIHVAGTNGKTTTVRMIADLLGAHGLVVGAFTSPHLEVVEERFLISGRDFSADEFTTSVADVAPFVELYEARTGESITYFELTAAIAFAAFASASVDVAVIEVGLGGRLDATNVADGEVAVVTGIAMDHMEWLGETLSAISAEKAAILKTASTLVTGELPPAAEGSMTARVAVTGSRWYRAHADYSVVDPLVAVGGWTFDLEGIQGRYTDLFLAIHGRHQVANFATAVAAVEAFFGRPLDPDAVREAAAAVTSPGRLEVVNRHPLVVLDGAHNQQGFEVLASALDEEFPGGKWILVTGARGNRDLGAFVQPLAGKVGAVVATASLDPDAIPADRVAAAVAATLAGVPVEVIDTVPEAVAKSIAQAGPDGMVIVAGSLYVVGEARPLLAKRERAGRDAAVHQRFEAEVPGDEDDSDDTYGDEDIDEDA